MKAVSGVWPCLNHAQEDTKNLLSKPFPLGAAGLPWSRVTGMGQLPESGLQPTWLGDAGVWPDPPAKAAALRACPRFWGLFIASSPLCTLSRPRHVLIIPDCISCPQAPGGTAQPREPETPAEGSTMAQGAQRQKHRFSSQNCDERQMNTTPELEVRPDGSAGSWASCGSSARAPLHLPRRRLR